MKQVNIKNLNKPFMAVMLATVVGAMALAPPACLPRATAKHLY